MVRITFTVIIFSWGTVKSANQNPAWFKELELSDVKTATCAYNKLNINVLVRAGLGQKFWPSHTPTRNFETTDNVLYQ